jgi:hypothetical protein
MKRKLKPLFFSLLVWLNRRRVIHNYLLINLLMWFSLIMPFMAVWLVFCAMTLIPYFVLGTVILWLCLLVSYIIARALVFFCSTR